MVITCPHCGKRLQAKEQAIGRILPCPSCKKDIDTSEAVEAAKRQELQPSLWHYMKEGWLKDEEVGPISEDEFVSLVRTGKVKTMTIVRSPQFTDNCWQNFKNVNFMAVEASYRKRREAERAAEQQRLARENIKQENLQRLRLLIRDVIADGRITQSEQQLLDQFAMTAQLSKTEVEHILRVEGKRLMDLIVAESLADGVFTPDEEARVQGVSAGLRIPMQFDDVTSDLIELSRLCWLFESCELDEFPTIESPVQLQAREMCFGRHKVEWNKVSQSSSARRSQSLSLDSLGVGDVLITSKRVLFMSDVQSKSVTHASIGRIDGYSDGILLVRTSGGSVFLRFVSPSRLENQKLTLLMRRVCLAKPGALRAAFPVTSFAATMTPPPVIPPSRAQAIAGDVAAAELVHESVDDSVEPRFTFRVVGTSYGNRQRFVDRLRLGDALQLVREPSNPADPNAVGVCDRGGNHLGYLKREVAEWFAHKLDRGESFSACVYRKRDDGILIAGVFEH